jgi:hypothetical protein
MKKLVIESLNEGFTSDEGNKMERIFNAIGYDDFHDFIGDNPGCIEVMTNWIDQYFGEQLAEEFSAEELDDMELYGSADRVRDNEDVEEDEDVE